MEAFKISQKAPTPSIQPGIPEESLKMEELRTALNSSSAFTSPKKTIVTLPQSGASRRERVVVLADDEPAREQEGGE